MLRIQTQEARHDCSKCRLGSVFQRLSALTAKLSGSVSGVFTNRRVTELSRSNTEAVTVSFSKIVSHSAVGCAVVSVDGSGTFACGSVGS